MATTAKFEILGANASNANWDGSPLTLSYRESAAMPQTTNGSMIFAYQNTAALNNAGKLALTSGGSQPTILNVPALLSQPSILVNNWQANNLGVTNISVATATPIWIEAFGPGLPGQKPVPLAINTALTLKPGAIAQGTSTPNWMQLTLGTNTGQLVVVAVVGGPQDASGNNAYAVALNSASGNTGPGTPTPAPQGYYATTGGNNYSFEFNWGSSVVYVANLSPSTASSLTAELLSL
ncbi:hypothetical protein ACFSQT_36390 [Mesorhizobium calcicola]|uniref:Uncharacterized protein n=1 Tax=Mesorhizobium calcicola TaxID=1300310 RepID=A0ABW4WPB3_9HYPH